MSDKYQQYDRFINGRADYLKEGVEGSVYSSRCVDLRSDPRSISLLPKTIKETGTSGMNNLPKWGVTVDSNTYIYDESGYLYKRVNSTRAYTTLRQVSDSHGNGLEYYAEDDFIYYTSDKALGRYGLINNSFEDSTFVDDFLGSEGGEPTNTHSATLVAASSQYFTRVDGSQLSITGDISMEAYLNLASLPSSGNEMVIMGKWNESSNQKSYKMSIITTASYLGDGSGGTHTISGDTTQSLIDASCSGTRDTKTLNATNASFAAGQEIVIIQMQGTNAGTVQRNQIDSYTAGTITLVDSLEVDFSSSGSNAAQVIVLPQYTTVTVNSGATWRPKAWDGSVGGVLAFLANTALVLNGSIVTTDRGFRGGSRPAATSYAHGKQGESYGTTSYDTATSTANYGAGGGGPGGGTGSGGNGGGGGSHATAGTNGTDTSPSGTYGVAGSTYGAQDLITSFYLGSGGGSGGNGYNASSDGGQAGSGGIGGGSCLIYAADVTLGGSAAITLDGGGGLIADFKHANGGGGGGSAGSCLINCLTADIGTSQITAAGGAAGYNTSGFAIPGGVGGTGRIHINYLTSVDGTCSPTPYETQDSSLNNETGYALAITVSDDGSSTETLSKVLEFGSFVDTWTHLGVVWDASESTAYFYLDGSFVDTRTGAMTSIYDSTAVFSVGADFNSSGTARSFLDSKIDEVRLWDDLRTASEISLNKDRELAGNEANLVLYAELDNAATDSGPNSLDLTAVNSPTYTTDVPFSAPTSRLDLDQSLDTSGDTYTLATSINDASNAHRQDFVPAKDPQKSIEVNIAAIGTGDWTFTIHDSLNRVVTQKTIANGDLNTGDFEVTWDTPWIPVLGATYHLHITSTVADGSVVTTTASNLNTCDFHTYYQFLVTDTAWHPLKHFTNKLVVGNGRYLGMWDASSYDPHRLTFPAGYRVRALGEWNEYLAIAVQKGTSIYEPGYIFFWRGDTSKTYDFFIKIPEGAPQAIYGEPGILNIFAGPKAEHLRYTGGQRAHKVWREPKIERSAYVEMYPGAVCMYDSLLRYAPTADSDSETVERGVYSFGLLNEKYNDVTTFDHIISTGEYGSTVKIGLVLPVNSDLLIGWSQGSNSGIDYMNPSNSPYLSGRVEFGLTDHGAMYRDKVLQKVRADFLALNEGESVGVEYKLDRETNWNTMTSVQATAGKTTAELEGERDMHKEMQTAVELYTTTTTSPKLLSLAARVTHKESEREF